MSVGQKNPSDNQGFSGEKSRRKQYGAGQKIRLTINLKTTLKGFQRAVTDLAQLCGWRVFHPYLSIRSAPGFPDLVLTYPCEPVIYAELKLDGKEPTRNQQAWLHALSLARGTEVYCWRPADWPAIEERLKAPRYRHR